MRPMLFDTRMLSNDVDNAPRINTVHRHVNQRMDTTLQDTVRVMTPGTKMTMIVPRQTART
jgi:hypothetical protein